MNYIALSAIIDT